MSKEDVQSLKIFLNNVKNDMVPLDDEVEVLDEELNVLVRRV